MDIIVVDDPHEQDTRGLGAHYALKTNRTPTQLSLDNIIIERSTSAEYQTTPADAPSLRPTRPSDDRWTPSFNRGIPAPPANRPADIAADPSPPRQHRPADIAAEAQDYQLHPRIRQSAKGHHSMRNAATLLDFHSRESLASPRDQHVELQITTKGGLVVGGWTIIPDLKHPRVARFSLVSRS